MVQYDVLKGSTVVGKVTVSAANPQATSLVIGSLVGTNACKKARINSLGIVEDYDIDWDRLDDDRVLDEQPWGLEPQ